MKVDIQPAISVKNLSKCYQIYDKPHDRLLQMFSRSRHKFYKEFWALKDISFSIPKKGTFGIVGRNGSGKSTLLQIICGTLSPTVGDVSVNGKVAALLELGAGFNTDFTGRENVYMAASLYGLSREEINSRFDAIAKFADIGEHLDQPVKTYSSGMYVRLAFSVIAHVDADILVIDEALSVGDAVFSQKCMRFIREFQKNGTLLFVSHDMSSVLNLCEEAIWLDQGEVRLIGKAKEVSEQYLQYSLQEIYGDEVKLESQNKTNNSIGHSNVSQNSMSETKLDYESNFTIGGSNLSAAKGWMTGSGKIASVDLVNQDGGEVLKGGELVSVRICAEIYKKMDSPILGFLVRDRLGQDLFGENTLPFTMNNPTSANAESEIEAIFSFYLPMLPNGQYILMASLADGDQNDHTQHHWLHDALVINVASSKVRWGLVGLKFQSVNLEVKR